MRHRVKGTQLNIDTSHRRALNRFMATSFVEKGVLTTTLTKAKFIRPYIEKLVTKAKSKNLRSLNSALNTRKALEALVGDVSEKFKDRAGGYTRIRKLGRRVGDNAPLARIEWVETIESKKPSTKEKVKKTVKQVSKEKSK